MSRGGRVLENGENHLFWLMSTLTHQVSSSSKALGVQCFPRLTGIVWSKGHARSVGTSPKHREEEEKKTG